MNLKPLGARVLIKPAEPVERTESGLHLVEHKKPEQIGTVVAAGSPTPCCDVGDLVLFSWCAGQEIFLHDTDERYLLLNESDLLAVLEPA